MGVVQGTLGQRTYGSTELWPTGAIDVHKSVYQMTHYFIQPQYFSELDYYGIFAILNTRITQHTGAL